MFPKFMKAAAGPHDFGSGNNHNETLPELSVESGSDPDPDSDNSRDPMTGDSSSGVSELELCHNVSSVCRFSSPTASSYLFV